MFVKQQHLKEMVKLPSIIWPLKSTLEKAEKFASISKDGLDRCPASADWCHPHLGDQVLCVCPGSTGLRLAGEMTRVRPLWDSFMRCWTLRWFPQTAEKAADRLRLNLLFAELLNSCYEKLIAEEILVAYKGYLDFHSFHKPCEDEVWNDDPAVLQLVVDFVALLMHFSSSKWAFFFYFWHIFSVLQWTDLQWVWSRDLTPCLCMWEMLLKTTVTRSKHSHTSKSFEWKRTCSHKAFWFIKETFEGS